MTQCKICNRTEAQVKFHLGKKTYCIECSKVLKRLNYHRGVVKELEWILKLRKGDIK